MLGFCLGVAQVTGVDFPTSVLLAAASSALGTTSANLKDALRFNPSNVATASMASGNVEKMHNILLTLFGEVGGCSVVTTREKLLDIMTSTLGLFAKKRVCFLQKKLSFFPLRVAKKVA